MWGASAFRALGALAACAACAAALALIVGAPGAAHPGARTASQDVLIPSNPRQVLPFEGRTVQSANWSGYAVTSKRRRITAVSGSFVVPTAAGSLLPQFAATWAGIGGYKTQDLIQAGTGEDSNSSSLFGKKYFAWYELLPNSETPLHNCSGDSHCRVNPGERISVTIRRVGRQTWTISVIDSGHWHWSRQVHYTSSRSSAEWILEAPTVGTQTTLAHVGTVHFGPTSRYTVDGAAHAVAHGHPIKIVLTGQATPSPLAADGQFFNDCAYRSSPCPRP
jgi:hypothetical protein